MKTSIWAFFIAYFIYSIVGIFLGAYIFTFTTGVIAPIRALSSLAGTVLLLCISCYLTFIKRPTVTLHTSRILILVGLDLLTFLPDVLFLRKSAVDVNWFSGLVIFFIDLLVIPCISLTFSSVRIVTVHPKFKLEKHPSLAIISTASTKIQTAKSSVFGKRFTINIWLFGLLVTCLSIFLIPILGIAAGGFIGAIYYFIGGTFFIAILGLFIFICAIIFTVHGRSRIAVPIQILYLLGGTLLYLILFSTGDCISAENCYPTPFVLRVITLLTQLNFSILYPVFPLFIMGQIAAMLFLPVLIIVLVYSSLFTGEKPSPSATL